MKRKLLFAATILYFLFSIPGKAQTVVFHEDFETVDSMSSSGTPAWFQDANYHTDGNYSIRDTVAVGGTANLTSIAFNTTGSFFVLLSFDQICKINFADKGYVEVSNDNGTTWHTLDSSHYLGASTFFPSFHYFSSFSYGSNGWNAASDTATPANSWWRTELFDISSLAANTSLVKVRFRITDGNGNGNSKNYGWLIDHVQVTVAPHELIPPVIKWAPPVLQGTIYSLGPFPVTDTILDASGVSSATLYYTINGGSLNPVTMNLVTGNIWQGGIPAVSSGDTICYYVTASDPWGNAATLPVAGCNTFIASSGITFPYTDNFDVNTGLWTSATAAGSSWQLGTPAFGVTNSAHSNPNAWDIDLATGYLDNTITTLTSPVFNFIGVVNATLSFWRNHRCESGWDGTRMEYTTNGITWQVLGTYHDPLGTNWYTRANINSSNTAAWDSTSPGWIQSKYKLSAFNNVAGPVQFRFVFTSDPSINQDGFSIDDFSITLPPMQDAGVTAILQPGASSNSGSNDSVVVVISNFGSQAISNFNVSYSVNGGPAVTQLFTGTILSGSSDTLFFSSLFTVPAGTFSLCSYTSLPGDSVHPNDTTCMYSFGISPSDAGVSVIVQPGNSSVAGTNAAVQVTLQNYGFTTLNSIQVGYKLNGITTAIETWNGTLPFNAVTNFTFATTFQVPSGVYSICSFTSLTGDGDHSNDTTCRTNTGIPRFTLPYTDHFDTSAVVWIDSSGGAGTNWQHGTPAFGQTTGSHSSPSCWDINLTSAYNNNASSYLVSPLFDFTGMANVRLSFWQNRNTENAWDGTRLEYSINVGNTWTVLGTMNDINAINWYNKSTINSSSLPAWDSISLSSPGIPGWIQSTYLHLPPVITGTNVRFRFVFTSDGSVVRDGISIDDFSLTIPPPNDVGVASVLQPGYSTPSNSTDSVKVVIYNFGSASSTNFPVSYRLNSGSVVTQNFSGTIQAGDFDTLTFSATLTVPAGSSSLCAWTGLTGDANHTNDTVCKTIHGTLRFTLPYTDNFDTGMVAWYDSSMTIGTNWQHGTPAFGNTTGAYSSPSCWDINLASGYMDNAISCLVSPLFNLTGITNARLSFWQNRNTEPNYDGMRLDYSTNAGLTWNVLGTANDTGAVNWYDNLTLLSTNLPGWDGSSSSVPGVPGWVQSTYLRLPANITGPNVIFRFVFTSDFV
ncbi:MAG: hypothetical protein NT126_05540, partial [Bacteroidetes bacterium]|nr:hypothetical protein [Bacteroidota bacterium]